VGISHSPIHLIITTTSPSDRFMILSHFLILHFSLDISILSQFSNFTAVSGDIITLQNSPPPLHPTDPVLYLVIFQVFTAGSRVHGFVLILLHTSDPPPPTVMHASSCHSPQSTFNANLTKITSG
jgi:hypothetical protein